MGASFKDWLVTLMDERDIDVRALARRCAEIEGRGDDAPRVSSWLTMLKRYRRGQHDPDDASFAILTSALGVDPGEAPPRRRRTSTARLAARLDELAAKLADVTTIQVEQEQELVALDARLRALEAPHEPAATVPKDPPTARRPQ